MTDRDELAIFDEEILAAVADDHDLSAERLTEVVRVHQSNVRDLPGVEDIVYEWRNHFHRDPLLGRTESAYYLALPDHVWDEFADHMALGDVERSALVAVHDRQVRRDGVEVGLDVDRLESNVAVVLTRP